MTRANASLRLPALAVLTAAALAVAAVPAGAQTQRQSETSAGVAAIGPTPVGTWQTEHGRSRVRIYRCGDKLCGRIVWLREPTDDNGVPYVDKRNPDPKLRDRPVVGLIVLWSFSKGDRPGRWDGGGMYHPEEGKYYKGALTLRPDGRLRVRGYRKVPVVGKTQYWTRVTPNAASE